MRERKREYESKMEKEGQTKESAIKEREIEFENKTEKKERKKELKSRNKKIHVHIQRERKSLSTLYAIASRKKIRSAT